MRVVAWPKRKNVARNPFQALLYDAVERQGSVLVTEFSAGALMSASRPDVLHIHWPDAFLAAGEGWKFWPRLALLRLVFGLAWLRRVPVVWTAHNFRRDGQRNSDRMDRLFWPWFLQRIDGVIFMTEASKLSALSSSHSLADTPYTVIPHGHYGPLISGKSQASSVRELPGLLFFGSITRYKNAHKLLRSFLDMPLGTARLAIRGKMSRTEPDQALRDLLANLPPERLAEVVYEDRFLEDAELVAAIRDTDLVVFPYSDVLNSGAAIFALSVGRPILASDNALFRELQGQVGPDWVRLIEGDLDAAQLSTALEQARALNASGAAPDLSAFEWDRIAAQTVEFYDTVISRRRRR